LAQAVIEQGVCAEATPVCAVECVVTPIERAAIQVLVECRPTLNVDALIAVLRTAPLCNVATRPDPTA
jgi:hypothetical protein